MWVPELDLRFLDKDVLEKDGLLSDRHMSAAQKLLKSQFPGLQGFQSTLFSQYPENFGPVSDKGMCAYTANSYKLISVRESVWLIRIGNWLLY